MKLLITGGVGFIGFHTSHRLLSRGFRLFVLDDFSPAPYPTAEKRANALELQQRFGDAVEIHEGCVTDSALVDRLLRNHSIDAVLHLAGLAGVRPSFASPAHYAKINVEGTMCVLEAVRTHSVPRLLIASSSSVYGNTTPLPATEDAICITPESPYAASKRAAELLVEATAKSMPDVAISALRFFTVYGPRQRPEMAITKFVRALLNDTPLQLFGDGSMRRDFTHVSDIVHGIELALERAPKQFRAYNLGSGAPISLRELIAALERAAGKRAQILHEKIPLGDVEATFADVSRAQRELGWEPKISLEEGLRSVVLAMQSPSAQGA